MIIIIVKWNDNDNEIICNKWCENDNINSNENNNNNEMIMKMKK